MDYEKALLECKNIDAQNSIEDIFLLAKIFYKLGKYQQSTKSNNLKYLSALISAQLKNYRQKI